MVPLRQEFRIAARSLRRAPMFSATMVLTIALAIGANASVFSVTHAVLLRSLPFHAPDRLVWIAAVTESQPNYPFSLPELLDYRDRTRTLEAIVAFASWSAIVGGDGPAERLQGIRISANAFEVLGVDPAAGRLLMPADDRADAARVAVLAFDTWQRRFAGRDDAIGTVALLNGEPFEIVGVLPRHFPLPGLVEVAVPLAPDRDPARALRRSVSSLRFIGRLRDEVTHQQAESELLAIATRLRTEHPDAYATKTGVSVRPLHDYLVRSHARGLALLMGAVGVALLVACGNMINLLLARAASRMSDVRIRMALGAGIGDVARALWAEAFLLSATGGVLGLVIGWWSLRLFVRAGLAGFPRLNEVGLDWQALAFVAAATVTVATILTVGPLARFAARSTPGPRIPELRGAPARGWLPQAVIVAEMALTLVLLLAAMLLVRSFAQLQDIDPGFGTTRKVVARIALPRASYRTPEAIARAAERFAQELQRIPGVVRVGGINVAPLSGVLATADFTVDGKPPRDPRDTPTAHYRVVTAGYLEALGVPVLRGRGFTERDNRSSPPVALVSRHLAGAFFDGEDAVGRRLMVNDNARAPRSIEIVGVVGDVRQSSLDTAPAFDIYLPLHQVHPDVVQWLANNQFWVMHTSGDVPDIVTRTRTALAATDPAAGLAHVRPLEEYVDGALAQRRFATVLSLALAGIALVLATVGIYGVMACAVAERTREIGLRTALGATRAAVWWLIARGALSLLAIGGTIGLLLSVAALRPLEALLFATDRFDPALVAASAAFLASVGVAAATVPAWRATRIDPATALRL